MNILNDLVNNMILQHEGGEKFFDNLDKELQKEDYIKQLWEMALCMGQRFIPISSGKFGLYFSSFLSTKGIFNIVVNGGLRKNRIISLEPWKNRIGGNPFVFFDDSFYLGRTRDKIKEEIEKWGGHLSSTYVCYDGSRNREWNVSSMYRYYDIKD